MSKKFFICCVQKMKTIRKIFLTKELWKKIFFVFKFEKYLKHYGKFIESWLKFIALKHRRRIAESIAENQIYGQFSKFSKKKMVLENSKMTKNFFSQKLK